MSLLKRVSKQGSQKEMYRVPNKINQIHKIRKIRESLFRFGLKNADLPSIWRI